MLAFRRRLKSLLLLCLSQLQVSLQQYLRRGAVLERRKMRVCFPMLQASRGEMSTRLLLLLLCLHLQWLRLVVVPPLLQLHYLRLMLWKEMQMAHKAHQLLAAVEASHHQLQPHQRDQRLPMKLLSSLLPSQMPRPGCLPPMPRLPEPKAPLQALRLHHHAHHLHQILLRHHQAHRPQRTQVLLRQTEVPGCLFILFANT